MLTTIVIVDLLRKKAEELGHNPTDYAVAKILGCKSTNLTNWVKHNRTMGDEIGSEAAKMLGLSPEYVIACLNAERAQETSTFSAWQNICGLLEGENDLHNQAA